MTTHAPAGTLSASRLMAILAADAAGFSRLMSIDDRLTVELLDAARAVFRAACLEHHGRVVDMAGDSVLLVFDSAANALRCALSVQQRLVLAHTVVDASAPRLPFRIGVHLGDVIEKPDGSVYGNGVNIAARLQARAEPDEVMVSQALRDLIGPGPVAQFEDTGEHWLKNITEPVRIWRALPPGSVPKQATPDRAGAVQAGAGAGAALRFGPAGRFELQRAERRLLIDGVPASLDARGFDLLLELLARPGELRAKNELIEAAWPGQIVEEGNLAAQIGSLRALLGGDLVVTIPGRGYRLAVQGPAPGAGQAAATAAQPFALPPQPSAPPAAAPAPAKLRTNLPERMPMLIGRDDDLAALDALVRNHTLVSIVGPGGMGKTALVQAFLHARRDAYPHGVCFVDLAPVTDPALVPATVIGALGVSVGSGDPLQELCAQCAPLQMLLALDNAEHLLEASARGAQALAEAAPGVRLVVTSQVPLRIAAERVHRLDGLAAPQGPLPLEEALRFGAVALFVDRARAADSRFALTADNLPAVIDICRQLDGLALAIELAAARAPMLGLPKLAAAMGERLRLLTGGRNRMAPARQQTLRATLEWSHGLLDATERTVFRRLAVFAGSGSLAMVQQVVADPDGAGPLDEWAVLDALALLVDRSLVVVLAADDASEPRYRLLDTPRAYALEKLKEAGEDGALRQRHMQVLAEFCEAAWQVQLRGEVGIDQWRRDFAREADNAAEAMACAFALGDRVAMLKIGAARLWASRNMPASQRLALAEQCIEQVDDTLPPALQARAWMAAASAWRDTRPQPAEAAARKALALAREAAALRSEPLLRHRVLCRFAHIVGHRAGATPEVQAALAEARDLEEPRWPPMLRWWRVQAEFASADRTSPEALRLGREVLSLDLAAGDDGFNTRSNLIDAELACGDAQAAVQTGEALLADLQGGRHENALAFTRLNLAAAWLMLDQAARARALAQAGWPQGRLFDIEHVWADYLALLAALEGRPRAAARLAGYADAGYVAREDHRHPNEVAARGRACTLARAALGDAAFEHLHAAGGGLADAQIEAIAFATEDSA